MSLMRLQMFDCGWEEHVINVSENAGVMSVGGEIESVLLMRIQVLDCRWSNVSMMRLKVLYCGRGGH